MILGPKVTSTRNRANTYFVELRFVTEENITSYDHSYFDFEHLLKLLSMLTANDNVELFDANLVDFIDQHFYFPKDTEFCELVDVAYVDDSSVFHYFDFDLSYIQQHHPELLL